MMFNFSTFAFCHLKHNITEIIYTSDKIYNHILFGLQYHEKYVKFSLNQTRAYNNNDEKNFNGSFFLKSHLSWIKFIEGKYEIIIKSRNIYAKFNIDKDSRSIETVIEGKIDVNNVNVDFSINHNFRGKIPIFGKIEYRTKPEATLIRVGIKYASRDIVVTTKILKESKTMFDFSIESKKFEPGRFRIKYESEEKKKIFKSELKYQNSQIAGCNFQINFKSFHDFLFIAKSKFQQNAFEFDIINNISSELLFVNVFIDNESILHAKYEKQKAPSLENIKLKLSSSFEFLHDIDFHGKIINGEEEHITRLQLKLNDFDGNMEIKTCDTMVHHYNSSIQNITIQTNLNILRRSNIYLNTTSKGNESVQTIHFKINDKYLKVCWDIKFDASMVTLQINIESLKGHHSLNWINSWNNAKHKYNLIFQDNNGKETSMVITYLQQGKRHKLTNYVITPFIEDLELKVEYDEVDFLCLASLTGIKSSEDFLKFEATSIFDDEKTIFNSNFYSYWTSRTEIHIELTGKIVDWNSQNNGSVRLNVKHNDTDILKADILLHSNTKSKDININISNISKQYGNINFCMTSDAETNGLYIILKVNEDVYFEVKMSYKIAETNNISLFLHFPYLKWNNVKCSIGLRKEWDTFSILLQTSTKFISFDGSYAFDEKKISAIGSLNSTFQLIKNFKLDFLMDIAKKRIFLEIVSEDLSHSIMLESHLNQTYANLILVSELPFLFPEKKEVDIQIIFRGSQYGFSAIFNNDVIIGNVSFIEESLLNINLQTPFPGLEKVVVSANYIDLKMFHVEINEEYMNGTFIYGNSYLELNISSSFESFHTVKLGLKYENNLKLSMKLNEVIINTFLKFYDWKKINFEIMVATEEIDVSFMYEHNLIKNQMELSVLIIYENKTYSYKVKLEEYKVEVQTTSPFYTLKEIKCFWDKNDLKFQIISNNKEFLTISLKHSNEDSLVGKLDVTIFIDIFDLKNTNLILNYSLQNQMKKLDFRAAYGKKVSLKYFST